MYNVPNRIRVLIFESFIYCYKLLKLNKIHLCILYTHRKNFQLDNVIYFFILKLFYWTINIISIEVTDELYIVHP